MPGGLLQLAISGAEDSFLVSNPQISFFKSVYRKYTRFSIETIKEIPNLRTLQETSETNITIKVPRNGDLLKNAYLTFTLPEIYSGANYTGSGTNSNVYNFQWIENIGFNIIKEASLKIGDSIIDTLYGEFMHVYSELHHSISEKENINELIGHVPEMYDPANSNGQVNTYGSANKYPHIVGETQYNRFNVNANVIDNTDFLAFTNKFPSILSRKIKVPLMFWFTKNSGAALPLIALQYHETRLDLTLRKINDLFTVLDANANNSSSSGGMRVKPNSSYTHTTIVNFLSDSSFVTDTTAAIGSRKFNAFNIDTAFEFEYIFLDEAERKRFALFDHEYLITQHKQRDVSSHYALSDSSKELNITGIKNPIKYLVVVPKRSDAVKINQHNNYTSWLYDNIPPYSYEYTNAEMFYDLDSSAYLFYNNNSNASQESEANFTATNFRKNLIEKMRIKFNGMNRTQENDHMFYQKQQPLQYFKKKPKDGIYLYSFSVDPKNDQPSGACNFSHIESVSFDCTFNQPPSSSFYTINVNFYFVNYNILKITSGMGGLVFS